MSAPAPDGGVGAAARRVAEHASALARLERELAQLEVRRKAAKVGAGVGLVVTAALLGLFALAFALAAAAAALTLVLPAWAALLVMVGFTLLVAAALGGAGAVLLRRGTPPVPERAIAEAKLTAEALRGG